MMDQNPLVRGDVLVLSDEDYRGWQRRDLYVREASLTTTRQARDRTG